MMKKASGGRGKGNGGGRGILSKMVGIFYITGKNSHSECQYLFCIFAKWKI